MSANIYEREYKGVFGKAFMSRENPAWWDYDGMYTFDKNRQVNVTEAADEIGALDQTVEKQPIYRRTAEGDFVAVPDRNVLVLTDAAGRQHDLDVVGSRYEPIQIADVTGKMDALVEQMPLETIGLLGGIGDNFVFCLDAGHYTIGGDRINNWAVVNVNLGSGAAMAARLTPVKFECQNTLFAGERAATWQMAIPHNRRALLELSFARELLAYSHQMVNQTSQNYQAMLETAISDADARWMIDETFSYPNKPDKLAALDDLTAAGAEGRLLELAIDRAAPSSDKWERGKLAIDRRRNAAYEAYEIYNDQYTDEARTVWAAYQGMTEVNTWRRGRKQSFALATITAGSDRVIQGNRAHDVAMAFVGERN